MTESAIRLLRRRVFGECSETNWQATRQNWMDTRSVEWLRDHDGKHPDMTDYVPENQKNFSPRE